MAAQGTGSSVRPYKKASEYMAQKQGQFHSSKRTMGSLERENAELRERVLNAERKLETMEVEYDQSREYFSSQLEMTKNKLDRSNEALKRIRESYTTLQNVNYDLEQRILKVSDLEKERQRLGLSVKEVLEKLNEAHSTIKKLNEENERLRNDCSLAVSLLHCNPDQFKSQTAHIQLYRDSDSKSQQDGDAFPMNEYNEHVNPYSEELFEDNHFSDPHISGFLAPAEKGNKEPRSWKPPSHETVKNDESARKPDRETGSPWQRRSCAEICFG